MFKPSPPVCVCTQSCSKTSFFNFHIIFLTINTFFCPEFGWHGGAWIENVARFCVQSACLAGFSPETLLHGGKLATLKGLCVGTLCCLSMQACLTWWLVVQQSISFSRNCFCDWFPFELSIVTHESHFCIFEAARKVFLKTKPSILVCKCLFTKRNAAKMF